MSSIVYSAEERGQLTSRLRIALLVLASVFLFVLPMPGKNALRTFALALALILAWMLRRREQWPALPAKPAFAIWLSMAAVSLVYSLDVRYSLGEMKVEILYGFVSYFVFYALADNARRFQLVLMVLLSSLWVIVLSALVLVWQQGDLTVHNYIYNGVGIYTTYLITLCPVLVLVGTRQTPLIPGIAVWALVPLALLTAYKTYNRMFWIALAITVLVCAILAIAKNVKRYQRGRLIVAGLALCVLIAAPLVGAMKQRLLSPQPAVADVVDQTLEVDPRPALWAFAARQIVDHPWTGSGFGLLTFDMAYPEWQAKNGVLFHAHNIFLDAGIQMGVPGMIVLALVFAFLLREYVGFYRSADPALWWLGVCGITLVVGVVVKNMTDHFFARDMALLFWAINGILLGWGKRLQVEARRV